MLNIDLTGRRALVAGVADDQGFGFAIAILAEAALSYLGLGTQPPQPSWGRMLAEAQTLMFQAPLLAVFPGLAIVLSVLGITLVGESMNDLNDPRLRSRRRAAKQAKAPAAGSTSSACWCCRSWPPTRAGSCATC